jgi:ankyrin repeat protein
MLVRLLLIVNPAIVNSKDKDSKTLLLIAAKQGH